ncbi:ethylene-responsive transcription factor ERF020 [Punica granatum]|uniref:Uncharacterized protein n=2 Tax=Punica granatum TaxID=22663 RepID=A0A2I0JFK3_PUNGR|nr:ethylene-responsive transcription factor ERF020 [Punica granatum]PKI55018.1 hypothetical protein CRG98_024618 [Punica granatum]
MSSSEESPGAPHRKYSGVRCRKWGKWVSEIRVPGTQERLWLGSYSTPEGAAMAHDIAYYCLRQPTSLDKLNFPSLLPPGLRGDLSPGSVQKAASDAGMAIDAQFISQRVAEEGSRSGNYSRNSSFGNSGDEGFRTSEERDHSHQYYSTGGGGGGGEGGEGHLSISVEDYNYS